jgi:hypothetical protein
MRGKEDSRRMNWTGPMLDIIQKYNAEILLGLAALVFVMLLWNIRLHAKLGKLSRRKLSAQSTIDPEFMEAIEAGLQELHNNSAQLAALTRQQDAVISRQNQCVQKLGLVRFNAFENIGGEQSFALAVMDAQNNGVLLSSLLSRTESRTYAKAITAGKSEQALSQEEQQALSQAMRM